jgi:nitroreductase
MLEEISKMIKARRSVKAAQMKPGSAVPKDVIVKALENAVYAPNHGRTEPWHFVVLSGESLRTFNQLQADIYKENAGENFLSSKYDRMLNQHKTVAYSIAIAMRRGTNPNIMEWEELAAVGCAVQNLGLTISAAGYGGMWATGNNLSDTRIKNFLDLLPTDQLLGFYLIGEILVPAIDKGRRPLDQAVTWKS